MRSPPLPSALRHPAESPCMVYAPSQWRMTHLNRRASAGQPQACWPAAWTAPFTCWMLPLAPSRASIAPTPSTACGRCGCHRPAASSPVAGTATSASTACLVSSEQPHGCAPKHCASADSRWTMFHLVQFCRPRPSRQGKLHSMPQTLCCNAKRAAASKLAGPCTSAAVLLPIRAYRQSTALAQCSRLLRRVLVKSSPGSRCLRRVSDGVDPAVHHRGTGCGSAGRRSHSCGCSAGLQPAAPGGSSVQAGVHL